MSSLWTRVSVAAACLAGTAPACLGSTHDACAQVECSTCPPIVNVVVTDARTGGPVPGAAATGGTAPWTCSESQGSTVCTSVQSSGTPPFDAEVTAPGYASATVHVGTVEQPSGSCCPSCTVYEAPSVQLTPL